VFTGIVETMGRIAELARRSGSTRLAVDCALAGEPVVEGESVAVDGACLTVARARPGRLEFDVVRETLEHTTLGAARTGERVNLERALRVGERLGGHLVQGHVDATAPVLELRRQGQDCRLRVGLRPEFGRFVVRKGSVALSGVSLTVAAVDGEGFEVALVPYTLERTTLGRLRPADRLNVEADLVARYLEGMLEARR
jgi:riboflavin synthase